jgi:hypothetical protein
VEIQTVAWVGTGFLVLGTLLFVPIIHLGR